MPTLSETLVDGYVWCCDPTCDGNQQRKVPLTKITAVYTYGEVDPESVFAAFPERSSERFMPVDEKDLECQVCGGNADVSDQKRIVYPSMMLGWDGRAFDQQLLLKLARGQGASDTAQVSDDVAELRQQVADLTAAVNASKRGPGRPRKTPDDEGDE